MLLSYCVLWCANVEQILAEYGLLYAGGLLHRLEERLEVVARYPAVFESFLGLHPLLRIDNQAFLKNRGVRQKLNTYLKEVCEVVVKRCVDLSTYGVAPIG